MTARILPKRLWRALIWLGGLMAALGAVLAAAPHLRALAIARLGSEIRARLAAEFGRPVEFGAILLSRWGVRLERVRLVRLRGETVDPVVVRRADMALSWWSLLRHRGLRNASVELEGVTVQWARNSDAPSVPSQPWTTQLQSLARCGLERVVVRHGTILQWGESGIAADDLTADARLNLGHVALRASARALRGDTWALTDAQLDGVASAAGLTIRSARATLASGGAVTAMGDYDPATRDGAVRATFRGVPLATLPLPALPSGVHFDGRLDGEATATLAHGALTGARVDLNLGRGTVAWAHERQTWSSVRAKLDWTPERLVAYRVRAQSDNVNATIEGTLATPLGHAWADDAVAATARVELDRVALARAARALSLPVSGAVRWQAQRATLALRVRGTAGALPDATITGHVSADEVHLAVPSTRWSATLPRVDADVTRTATRVDVRQLATRYRGLALRANVALTGPRANALEQLAADGALEARDLTAVRRAFLPPTAWPWLSKALGTARARFRLAAPLRDPSRFALDGHVDVADIGVTVPAPAYPGPLTIPVRAAAADFTYRPAPRARSLRAPVPSASLALRGLRIESPLGRITGSADATHANYRAALRLEEANPELVHALVGGQASGGRADATIELVGSAKYPVQLVRGHLEVANTRYTPPAELDLAPDTRLAVTRFGADLTWAGGRTTLNHAVLLSDAVDGAGSITCDRGTTVVHATLATRDLGRVSRAWPSLVGLFRGGRANGRLDATFGDPGTRGVLSLQTAGGDAVIPAVPTNFATHPIDSGHAVLRFEPGGWVNVDELALRGPRGNIDARGGWSDTGPLAVRGQIWLTPSYSAAVIRPSGYSWLAPLLGLQQIHTDFTLRGTLDHALLDTSIAHGPRWALIRSSLSQQTQRLLRGEMQLPARPTARPSAARSPRS